MASDTSVMESLGTLLTPWRWWTSPVFIGLDRIPSDKPLLFVGNHTLMGMLDVPLLMAELWDEKGIEIHSLGDHLHFQIPRWRELVESFGVIEGTREGCSEAMRAGLALMVFPGGGREVTKRRDEKYKLLWGDRTGFARLAIEHRYTIIPFASVGADDCWDILIDGDDILRSPLRPLVERYHPRPDLLPPLVRGVGFSAFPRPERFYFEFGEAIDASAPRFSGGRDDGESGVFKLREETRASVEDRLASLQKRRDRDPGRSFGVRTRRQLERFVPRWARPGPKERS